MQRDYDIYDTMTLAHGLSVIILPTVSYLLTDTESVSVSVMSVSCILS